MFFLGIYGGYKEISVGIFAAQKPIPLVEGETIPNAQASKQLVFVIDRLLEKHNLGLQDLAFIFVNQGPAPFTTLRTVLATVNALSFAINIPLVGIDSLKTLATESSAMDAKTVVLLDAFNNDVYYCFKAHESHHEPEYKTGYENISALIMRLQQLLEDSQKSNQNIRLFLIGNGAQLHRQQLESALQDGAVWAENIPLAASFNVMAECALEDFQAGRVSHKLSPLYLKLHPAEIAKQAA